MTEVSRLPLRQGESLSVPVITNLTRSSIVQYAGASGDYNPLHTDERYAREIAGQPTVMAHGMLTMGLTGSAVMSALGGTPLVRFGGRFLGAVWPGDSLTLTLQVDQITEHDSFDLVELTLTTLNQHREPVFSGSAAAHVPR